ncbi:transcriptional regulator [Pseudodesulfovibrio cashew]|uniref:Transcriptional regulator n=1 Tax=Pseudodesulfovibrio cashew TaxID=2678688 RepID=A0A6I6JE65_9BACT|nr:transcriptional regulator [Pseudodesulfovibrio cashew]QGY38722.1 transcriptional regulator [Pseudodesulfovibrio cashew]
MAENNTDGQSALEQVESHVPEQLHPILEAAFKHQKQLVIAVTAIVAIAAIYSGITAYNQRALTDTQAELGKILIKTAGEEKITKLEALLASAPSGAKPAILLELARANMTNGQYDKAADYWNQITGDTDDELRYVARLGKAKALSLAGKPAEAVVILKDLAASANPAMTLAVNRQLAVAAEQAGDNATALAAYRKVAEQQNIPDKPFIDYKIAQLEAK